MVRAYMKPCTIAGIGTKGCKVVMAGKTVEVAVPFSAICWTSWGDHDDEPDRG